MTLYNGLTLLKTYKVALGKNPRGKKQLENEAKHWKVYTLTILKMNTALLTKAWVYLIPTLQM
jgi:hypothetical protein